jgi:hypothetical protein
MAQRKLLNAEITAHYQGGSADVIRKAWKEVRKIEKYVGHVIELQGNITSGESVKNTEIIEVLNSFENAKPVRDKTLRLRGGGPKQRKFAVRDTKTADSEEKGLV